MTALIRPFSLLALALAVLLGAPVSAPAIDVPAALEKLGFPADTEAKVRAGQFVETPLATITDTDLNVGIAFLVQKKPEQLTRALFDDLLLQRVDPAVTAHGTLADPGAPEQLAALTLTPAQQKAYAAPEPGQALNLSPAEIRACTETTGGPTAVAATVRQLLVRRFQTYRENGIDGLASYARTSGRSNPGSDLVQISQAARTNAILPAAFYDVLESYPRKAPADLKEVFHWSQFKAHGADTIALTHAFTGEFGGVLVAVQRQFYVSTGYNAEQAIAGFVPVPEGTLVVYTNHTSTDQVTGLGGSAKRSIGRKFMASQLEGLFKKVAAAK